MLHCLVESRRVVVEVGAHQHIVLQWEKQSVMILALDNHAEGRPQKEIYGRHTFVLFVS